MLTCAAPEQEQYNAQLDAAAERIALLWPDRGATVKPGIKCPENECVRTFETHGGMLKHMMSNHMGYVCPSLHRRRLHPHPCAGEHTCAPTHTAWLALAEG